MELYGTARKGNKYFMLNDGVMQIGGGERGEGEGRGGRGVRGRGCIFPLCQLLLLHTSTD